MMQTSRAIALDFQGESRPHTLAEPQSTVLVYSRHKLRAAAKLAILAAVPAFACALTQRTAVHAIALAYLVVIVLACDRIRRLAQARRCAAVVSAWGITLAAQGVQLRWQDVKRIAEVRSGSAKAIDIELMWPERFGAHSSRAVRFGAWCQRALRLPAITLSLWLVDASAHTFIEAVRVHRPDLLHVNNRV